MTFPTSGPLKAASRMTRAFPYLFSPNRDFGTLAALATTAAVLTCPGLASAQEGEPPAAALRRGADAAIAPTDFGHAGHDGAVAALEAPDLCPEGDVCYDLRIDYVPGEIRNPNFPESSPQGRDQVRLRGYIGEVVGEDGQPTEQMEFVAPLVELAPGDTFRLTLHNDLPRFEDMELPGVDAQGEPLTCLDDAADHNQPHCAHFNLTNMHTHGLWVSPLGNSDNVLITINPGVPFTYEYNIPSDHPAGTFWYHAHRHGSTGPQLASGMAGALIIRDDRTPQLQGDVWSGAGDVDLILPRPEDGDGSGPAFPERVMLFQQIAYACRNPDGTIKTFDDDDGVDEPEDDLWRCDPGDVGTLEPGPVNPFDQLTPASWPQSGRHTAINGVVQKVLEPATAGEVERWRLIHAGVRQSIDLQIRKAASPEAVEAYMARGMAEPEGEQEVTELCSGEPLEVVGLATDGLTRPALDPRTETWLQPGYREDILVSFPEAGTYCIINDEIAGTNNINAQVSEPALLGMIDVAAPEEPLDEAAPTERVVQALVESANAVITETAVRDRVVADLQDGMRLTGFVKHRDIPAEEVTGQQTVGFNIAFPPLAFMIGEIEQDFLGGGGLTLANAAPYDPSIVHRLLPLGETQEWFLTSFGGGGHPFHIHVNPFQIVSVRVYAPPAGCFQRRVEGDPAQTEPVEVDTRPGCGVVPNDPSTWLDVSAPGSQLASGPLESDGSGGLTTSQHAGLKGAWKDTVFTPQGHLVQFRTRYDRYIGDFVLHCHILDHEDQGMMQNVRIALTDGRGGFDIPLNEHEH